MTMGVPPMISEHTEQEEVLINAVRDALSKYDPIRIWGDDVHIGAHGSAITLSGYVRSQSSKEMAGKLASQVGGVSAVENNLVVDGEVEVAIAQALGADPRTQSVFPGVLVGVVFGVVYLKGIVTSPEIKTAAGEIAAKVPGVRTVSNELTTVQVVKAEIAKGAKPEAAVRPS